LGTVARKVGSSWDDSGMKRPSPDNNEHGLIHERRAYKIQEAAEIIGVKPISIRRLISRGLLKPCRVLRHVLIPGAEIDRLLNN